MAQDKRTRTLSARDSGLLVAKLVGTIQSLVILLLYTFQALERPRSRSNSSAPVSYNSTIGHLRCGTYGEFRHKAGEVPYKYLFLPRPSLSILEIAEVREEALDAPYQKGPPRTSTRKPTISSSSAVDQCQLARVHCYRIAAAHANNCGHE